MMSRTSAKLAISVTFFLEIPAVQIKAEHRKGGFELKNFSYIYSLFIRKNCMESKIIEYAICG